MHLLLAALAFAGPHADHVAQFGHVDAPAQMPLPALLPAVTNGPDRIVYGYEAYWNANLQTIPWDDISHLAIFSAGVNTGGHLTDTARFDRAIEAVSIAAAYNVKIHLCVTNFTGSELTAILSSSSARQTLIDELVSEVARTGAHGVNIDFEGLPASQRANMVTFVTALDTAVDEVVLATPAVDWSGAWDYAALTDHSWLFIMGYGYHWSRSEEAGPVDPLYGGGVWSAYSLDWTANDYLSKGADADKVILGMPLYGNKWPVSSTGVPAETTGTGSAVIFSTAWENGVSFGENYDETTHSNYYNANGEQTWYGDTDTVQDRIEYAESKNLGGFGFWAMHYTGNDASFWGMIHEKTLGGPREPGSLVANAGRPFLAYVGDTIILTAENSVVPTQGATYLWEQVGGPEIGLANPDNIEASFLVREAGIIELDLMVGDGRGWSAPDRTQVVVLDRDIGENYRACGVQGGPLAVGSLVGLLGVFLRRRRR